MAFTVVFTFHFFVITMESCSCKAKVCEECNVCSRCCQHNTAKRNKIILPSNCGCKSKRCGECKQCSRCCQHAKKRKKKLISFAVQSKQNKNRLLDLCLHLGVGDNLMPPPVNKGEKKTYGHASAVFLKEKIRNLPSIQRRAEIKELNKHGRHRLLKLLNCAVMCIIRTFIPIGDVGPACYEVSQNLQKYYQSSYFIRDVQKDAIIDDMATVCAKLPFMNLQRRVVLAILTNNLKSSQLNILKEKYHIDDKSETNVPLEVEINAKPIVTRRQITKGKRDVNVLLGGKQLTKATVPREKKSPAASESVVTFLLNKDIIKFLSWGNTKLKINLPDSAHRVHIIPALNRTKHLSQLFGEYDELHKESPLKDRVGKSSFFAIAGQLTAKEIRSRAGVYEFANQHGFHNFKRIQSLITTLSEIDGSRLDKILWLEKANSLEAFLRQGFKKHVRNFSDPSPEIVWEIDPNGLFICPKNIPEEIQVCYTHSTLFALGFAPESNISDGIGCSHCAGLTDFFTELHSVIESLPSSVTPSIRDALEIRLSSCERSVKMYMAHQIRTINQSDRIDSMCDNLKSDEGMLVVDFKQKVAPQHHRESQQNYFGKRGMSWHGCMLTYCDPETITQETRDKKVHYFDQIIENDTVQDFTSVACCIESALFCIKNQFPFLKRLILVSDNAKCYSGNGLLGVIAALSVTSGIKIERIIHGEAGTHIHPQFL